MPLKKQYFRTFYLIFSQAFIFLNFIGSCYAQTKVTNDTVSLNLRNAEDTFLKNNLSLLAQKYNISAQKAFILQAKLYPNPSINVVQGAYNTQTGKWFQTGKEGEEAVQVQQLVLLAGKINKQVKIAESNALLAEYNFYDLLRTLRFTLRNDFYQIYYLQQSASVYDEEIRSLEKISSAFEQQRDKGYIARSEVVRIKAQLYSLRNELNDLKNQINDRQSEFRTILQLPAGKYVIAQADTNAVLSQHPQDLVLQNLMDSAYHNRPDLMIAQVNHTLTEQNYAYQKSLAVPDLLLGGTYDRRGSYIPNFNGISVGLNIPLFNRNQGNIKAYKNLIEYSDLQEQSVQKTIEEQVYRAYERAIDADKLYASMDRSFTGEFTGLAKAVFENYQKRNISLIDFLNFYDSYKQYMVQLNYILQNRVTSMENINYLTGTNFFN
jgi:Outer membrane protein